MTDDRKTIIMRRFARAYLRHGRGSALFSFFVSMVKDTVYIGLGMDLAYRWFNLQLPYWFLGVFVLAMPLLYLLAGFIDEKLGFWKIQNDVQNEELTPFFKKLDGKLNELLDKKK